MRRIPKKAAYRSGFEDKVALWIENANRPVIFEQDKLKYNIPEREATYTPDFKLFKSDGTWFYLETKGLLTGEDRKKHLLVRDSNPDTEIRFLFQRAKSPIYKGSKTTYGAWATKHGFLWAEKDIPQSWLEE